MKIYTECGIEDFKAWSGAVDTQNRILEEGKADDFDGMMDELYPDGMDEMQLNDLLWFERDWIFESLGIYDEEEEERE